MKQRLISSIILLIIVVPLIIFGGIYFKIGMSILGILSLKEILNLKKDLPREIKIISYILISLFILFDIDILIKIYIILIILFILMVFYDRNKYNIENSIFLSLFIIFIMSVYSGFIDIRENDINILIYLLLITISTDTFAYIGGKTIGKHKLIEKVSPNKTIEGTLTGLLLGTIIPSIFYIYMVDPGENIFIILIITLIMSCIGQLGDLVFSSIKRYYGIKDFSNLIPGHGGVLDRLDSIIFVVMAYLTLFNFI